MVSAADVRKLTSASMATVPVSSPSDKTKHGNDFYQYFFTHHPEVRKYFKGAENYAADDVAKSERFDKLGNDILLAVHVLTETYENDNVFRGVCRDVINRHVEGGRHLDPALWKVPTILLFLTSQEYKKSTEALFGVQKMSALGNALLFSNKGKM
ncbi:globin [Oesophagostomum dentatum]|uniref:Globin n=1 Tax=Oesophagostomum dentatum TaxID=61180 RepID=A0A0B1SS10_OESDE|nr:globin [Oesophagostomum dentatum]